MFIKKLLFSCIVFFPILLHGQSLYHIKIQGDVDPFMVRQVREALRIAKESEVQVFLVEINTFGGLLESADSIRSLLLNAPFQTVSFVNHNAASAGALIAISCKEMYMTPGSTIGAATVLMGNSSEPAPEKYQSYMRGLMRGSAEVNQRDPKIAEKMVDASISIPEVAPDNTILTLSAQEAVQVKYAKGIFEDFDHLVKSQWSDYKVITHTPSAVDTIISWLVHPAVSSFLLLLIFIGVVLELKVPGLGFPIGMAFVCSILFFTPHYVEGLADIWEIAIFVLGTIFLAVEILIIPGFGFFGVVGILLMTLGLVAGLIYNYNLDLTFVSTNKLLESSAIVVVAFFVGIICAVWLTRYLISIGYSSAVLNANTLAGVTSISSELKKLIGLEGITVTDLKPIGQADFEGKIRDVQTKGTFVTRGSSVKIIATDSNHLIVEPIKPPDV